MTTARQDWARVLESKRQLDIGVGTVFPTKLARDEVHEVNPLAQADTILEYAVEFNRSTIETSRLNGIRIPTTYHGWVALAQDRTFEQSIEDIIEQVKDVLTTGDGPPLSLSEVEMLPVLNEQA